LITAKPAKSSTVKIVRTRPYRWRRRILFSGRTASAGMTPPLQAEHLFPAAGGESKEFAIRSTQSRGGYGCLPQSVGHG
jgi:hypothetical protein